jgi:hypothetical protein
MKTEPPSRSRLRAWRDFLDHLLSSRLGHLRRRVTPTLVAPRSFDNVHRSDAQKEADAFFRPTVNEPGEKKEALEEPAGG